EWFELWRGSSSNEPKDIAPGECLNLCHELFSEIEASVSETAWNQRRDSVWAFALITERLSDFKGIFQLILPNSNPRISLLASGDDFAPMALRGFDEVYNLGLFYEVWEELAD